MWHHPEERNRPIPDQAELLPVTVAIPVRNEEAHLAQCLARLGRFADIVVIDSASTDRTVEIAEKAGARVISFRWNGRYPKKSNWFLLNHRPPQPWVLFLDADEFVDDAFCDAVAEAVTDRHFDGYWLNYTNHFLGQPLLHGLAQRKLAMFRVGTGLYERIEEEGWSGRDVEIHEHPVLDGPLGEIHVPICHRNRHGLAAFVEKHLDYARWEACRYARLKQTPEAWPQFTRRQAFKYRYLSRWWFSPLYFLFTYVWKLGVLDGMAGYHYAAYKAWYFRTIRLMIHEQDNPGPDRW